MKAGLYGLGTNTKTEGIMSAKNLYSVLLVENDQANETRLDETLKKIPEIQYRIHRVENLTEAGQAVLSSPPDGFDLCLIDQHSEAEKALEFIASHSGNADFPPMILITHQPNREIDQQALEAGALDTLYQSDINPAILERAIRYACTQYATRQQLIELETTDPLTGILNRRTLYDIGNKEFDRAVRYGHQLSIILIGMDHLSIVNDQFGYATGDNVLTSLVKMILEKIRETDAFGRFGGEEFVLILPHTTLDGACQLATRICDAMKHQPVIQGDRVMDVSISCGVCAYSEKMEFFDELIVCADRALHHAKAKGRNRVEASECS